jgi:hypothetical protein
MSIENERIVKSSHMIRTYYLPNTTAKVPATDMIPGYEIINVLKWNGTPWKGLCPYLLKTDGKEQVINPGGIIFENFWQGTKVFKRLYPQEQYASRFHHGQPEHLWFKHNMTGTLDMDMGPGPGPDGLDLVKYHQWRDLVWSCTKPVRYPNGANHKAEVLYSVGADHMKLDYLTARKEIYVKEYCRLAAATPEFKRLKAMHDSDMNLMICEMDVPCVGKKGLYGRPEYANGRRSVELTTDILNDLLEDPSAPFGHGLCLAKLLLKVDGT